MEKVDILILIITVLIIISIIKSLSPKIHIIKTFESNHTYKVILWYTYNNKRLYKILFTI